MDPVVAAAIGLTPMREALTFAAAYLLGALPVGWLLAHAWGVGDIRTAGSGNVGATNVLRTSGVLPALITLIVDVGKGAVAVWLARRAGVCEIAVAAAGLIAIVGHVFPVWLRWRGGKGVATAAGAFLLLAPAAALVAVAVFAVTVTVTRRVSLGSVGAAAVLVVATIVGGYSTVTIAAATLASALIIARHTDNIGRLRAGTEPRIT